MKQKLKMQVTIDIFLGICMLIGLLLSKEKIETQGWTLATAIGLFCLFWLFFLGLSLLISWLLLRNHNENIPEFDERTIQNMILGVFWAFLSCIFIASIAVIALFFLSVKTISINTIAIGLCITWLAMFIGMGIGKYR
ncbi:hypothetical protein SFB97_10995 [Enterococcus hirae]|uniref:hypothetical protein n=1 Tax=Enterococcus hirae TaxID=1354 RepID=UPI003918EA09